MKIVVPPSSKVIPLYSLLESPHTQAIKQVLEKDNFFNLKKVLRGKILKHRSCSEQTFGFFFSSLLIEKAGKQLLYSLVQDLGPI